MGKQTKKTNVDGMIGISQRFAVLNRLITRDMNNNTSAPTFSLYSKDNITEYLTNPYTYEKQLRKAQDLVEVGDDRELGRAARLGLEHIVEHGDAHGGVEVVVHLLGEFRAVLGAHGLVHAALVLEVGDLRKELVVGEYGVVQILPGEHEALAIVALQTEEAVGQRVVALLLKQGNGQKFALGLAHFAVRCIEVGNMAPVGAPRMSEVAFGLGDLVRVVREGIVHAAAVQVEVFAVVLHGDAGALDVPAGIAHAPGGIPLQGLILELGLGEPQHKVVLVALVHVLLHALPDAYGQILLVVVVEHIVPLQLARVEVDVAAGEVGVAGVKQPGDDLDIVVDEAGGGLHDVGTLDVELLAVGKEGVGIELRDLHDGLVLALGALEHLVLALVGVARKVADVGDVHDAVDAVACEAEVLLQHILHDVAAQIADVGKVIDSRAAGVHLDVVRGMGLELFLFVGGRIIEVHTETPFQSKINLASVRLAEHVGIFDEILNAGIGGGQHDDGIAQGIEPRVRAENVEQHRAEADHGRGRFDLAGPRRGNHAALLDGNEPHSGDRELAQQHDGQTPAGHLPDLDEVAHGRHDEHLVRQRVHELAEIRDLVVVAGDVAVHEIREARDHEHAEGGAARIGEIQIQDHKKYGDERHPRKGELIGSRHL